jgi:hypothetical protein
VVTVDEDHRRDAGGRGVEVLAGVLEDLLHRARGAGQEDDPAGAAVEQRRLAYRVLEQLGDAGGEQVRRLVPVEPRRHPDAAVALGPPLAHVEGGERPRLHRRLERRHRGQHLDRSVELVVGLAGEVGTEVGRLHRAGAAAGGDEHSLARQPATEPRRLAVTHAAAQHAVAAHHADDPASRPRQRRFEGGLDGRVVQRPGHEVGGVGAALLRPRIGAGVHRLGIANRAQTHVQLVGGVQLAAVRIDRRPRHLREHQRATIEEVIARRRLEGATEEQRPGGVAVQQRRRLAPEVEAAHAPAVHRDVATGDRRGELVRCVDLDDPAQQLHGATSRASGR